MKRHLAAALIGCCISTAHALSNSATGADYCDAYTQAALKFYEARLAGVTHLIELREVPAVVETLNPSGGDPEGVIDVTLMVLQHAYTFSFPSAQAFADYERTLCLK